MSDFPIDISGLNKAHVLAALFNGSKQQGMGFLDESGAVAMTIKDAGKILTERAELTPSLYFDYVRGRVMKVDLTSDELRPALYDRDNGEGAAARVINDLKAEQGKNDA